MKNNDLMKKMFSIVRAAEKDCKPIADIGKIAVEEAHRDSCSVKDMTEFIETNYNYTTIKEELRNSKNIYHLLNYNEKPVGFSKIILNSEHPNISQKNTAKLDRIYLLKAFHNLKLGFELLKFNIEFCQKHGQSGIWLYTWIGNTRAISFYQKTGFKIIGSYDFKITETRSNPNHQMLLDLNTML